MADGGDVRRASIAADHLTIDNASRRDDGSDGGSNSRCCSICRGNSGPDRNGHNCCIGQDDATSDHDEDVRDAPPPGLRVARSGCRARAGRLVGREQGQQPQALP